MSEHGTVTALTAIELARRIARRELSSRDVTAAFIRRIEELDPQLNAIVVRRFAAAWRESEDVDKRLQRGEPAADLPPLLGVPVTVKENFHLAGTPCCIGLSRFRDALSPHDSPLVTQLRRAGAVILGKTNLSQLMYFHECDNPVYGCTKNPWNLARTPGGSSGGEAAALAANMSALGLGSDLGGSIRVPAHFSGVCGLKPTARRLPRHGTFETFRGLTTIGFQPGPLARTTADLALAWRILARATAEPDTSLDRSDTVPVAWRDPARIDLSRLVIGVWHDDPFFPVSPAIRRAMEEAADFLARQGATIRTFVPPSLAEAVGLYLGIMSVDGGAELRHLAAGSRLDPRMRRMLWLSRIPRTLRLLLAESLQLIGQPGWAFALRHSGPRTGRGTWGLAAHRRDYVSRVRERLDSQQMDAVICPPYGLPALRHGRSVDAIHAASYAFWANVMEFPCGIVPVTTVSVDETRPIRPSTLDVVAREACRNEKDSEGLPVGVQVVARPWREDIVLAIMQSIEGAANFAKAREAMLSRLESFATGRPPGPLPMNS